MMCCFVDSVALPNALLGKSLIAAHVTLFFILLLLLCFILFFVLHVIFLLLLLFSVSLCLILLLVLLSFLLLLLSSINSFISFVSCDCGFLSMTNKLDGKSLSQINLLCCTMISLLVNSSRVLVKNPVT